MRQWLPGYVYQIMPDYPPELTYIFFDVVLINHFYKCKVPHFTLEYHIAFAASHEDFIWWQREDGGYTTDTNLALTWLRKGMKLKGKFILRQENE